MEAVVDALERDNFMDPEQAAKDWGLIDEIVENRVPKATTPHKPDLELGPHRGPFKKLIVNTREISGLSWG